MDETVSSINPQGVSARGGGGMKKIILPVIILLIAGGIVFGGVSYFRSRGEAIPTPSPVPTAEPTEEPTPTPESTPSASPKATPTRRPTATPTKAATSSATSKGLSVRVVNGTTTAGLAASLADYLKGLGYEIAGTGTDNEPEKTETTISIKSSKSSLLSGLKTDVGAKYSVGSTSATLSSSADSDAVVTIGKQ